MYTLHRQPSVLTFPWLMKSTNKQFFFRYLLLWSPGIHSLTKAKHMLIGSAPKLLYALNIFLGALYVVLFVSEFGIPKYFTQKWWHGMPKALIIRFKSWLRLNWLFISWPVANFSPLVAFGTQLAKPMVIPQEHASQHLPYSSYNYC